MIDIFENITAIDRFDGEYRFLSNFFDSEIELNGKMYPTVEHAYQAAKTFDEIEIEKIRTCRSPGKAKRLGAALKTSGKQRDDWHDVSLIIMEALVYQKFENDDLRSKLIDTKPRMLIEGNEWGDTFWGTCDGIGENHLGKILMRIRNEMV
jgi:ribA/ribD-fused uncharacterized protein